MKGHGTKFSHKMEEAVAALLTQRNLEEAARTVGVSVATLIRWQKLPEFNAAYREARRAAFGQAVARLQQGTSAAATTLLKTLMTPLRQHRSGCGRPRRSSTTLPRRSRSRISKHACRYWRMLLRLQSTSAETA